MTIRAYPFGATVALLMRFCVSSSYADERILDFHSDIEVHSDASMEVTEQIRVNAQGNRINHGIYRDFPTDYRDRHGNRVRVDFTPLDAKRDGAFEAWHAESFANGVRVYLGSKTTHVATGEHVYTLSYRTTRQLGFFADHDELYWNVTGNGWAFAIDHASAAVQLPGNVAPEKMTLAGYTGAQGEQGKNFKIRADGPSHVEIETTRALDAKQGLTVAVGFPKNIVVPPTASQQAYWLLRDNLSFLIGAIGWLLILIYYYFSWRSVGQDPKRGVIFPRYDAPAGISPGAIRYVERMAYDPRCFAADLVDLSVRGAMAIRQENGVYQLIRQSNYRDATLPKAQADLLHNLLGLSVELTLQPDQHPIIGRALLEHSKRLAKDYGDVNFQTNSGQLVLGVLISIATVVAMVFASGSINFGLQMALMGLLSLSCAFAWFIGLDTLVAWRRNLARGRIARFFKILVAMLLLGLTIIGVAYLGNAIGLFAASVFLLIVLTNLAFSGWLKAPTPAGRKLLDHIEGLRLYLGVAERDELALQQVPPLTQEQFQKFLPYALALEVEKTWGDRFAATLPTNDTTTMANMGWYQSNMLLNASNIGQFSSNFSSSFSSAIASSASSPGSSSGLSGSSSGGGGFSGGGGGGGGGGGW